MAETTIKQHYPKWKYHREEPAVVVHTPEHEEELGDEWKDSPAHFEGDPAAAESDDEDTEPAKPAKGKKKK